jgi:hypothetical protein
MGWSWGTGQPLSQYLVNLTGRSSYFRLEVRHPSDHLLLWSVRMALPTEVDFAKPLRLVARVAPRIHLLHSHRRRNGRRRRCNEHTMGVPKSPPGRQSSSFSMASSLSNLLTRLHRTRRFLQGRQLVTGRVLFMPGLFPGRCWACPPPLEGQVNSLSVVVRQVINTSYLTKAPGPKPTESSRNEVGARRVGFQFWGPGYLPQGHKSGLKMQAHYWGCWGVGCRMVRSTDYPPRYSSSAVPCRGDQRRVCKGVLQQQVGPHISNGLGLISRQKKKEGFKMASVGCWITYSRTPAPRNWRVISRIFNHLGSCRVPRW